MQWLQQKKSNIVSVRFFCWTPCMQDHLAFPYTAKMKLQENALRSTDGIPNIEMSKRFVEEEFKLLDDDEWKRWKRRIWPFDWSEDTISCC